MHKEKICEKMVESEVMTHYSKTGLITALLDNLALTRKITHVQNCPVLKYFKVFMLRFMVLLLLVNVSKFKFFR